ncbi:MAG: thermonuclease family protein [Pseudomonadota bacterium]
MFRFLVVFLFLLYGALNGRADTLPGPIPAQILRIVDGDTVHVRASIWVDQTVEVSVRLRGVDAPEVFRPKCQAEKVLASAAKESVAAAMPVGSHVTITDITRDKYGGRVVATILMEDGQTLSDHLLAKGQAVPYDTPKPWCHAF